MELSFREPVLHLLEQGLLRRLPPPEPVEPHHPAIEVHLRSNQPIQPLAIHFEAVTQQLDLSYRIGSPDYTIRPRGWAWRFNTHRSGKVRRHGADSIRADRWRR